MSKRMHTTEQRTAGTLIERTERIVQMFDAEEKTYAFSDGQEALTYAAEMADLLEQWANAGRASRAMHPSNQGGILETVVCPEHGYRHPYKTSE